MRPLAGRSGWRRPSRLIRIGSLLPRTDVRSEFPAAARAVSACGGTTRTPIPRPSLISEGEAREVQCPRSLPPCSGMSRPVFSARRGTLAESQVEGGLFWLSSIAPVAAPEMPSNLKPSF